MSLRITSHNFGCAAPVAVRPTALTARTSGSCKHSRSTPRPIIPVAPKITTFIGVDSSDYASHRLRHARAQRPARQSVLSRHDDLWRRLGWGSSPAESVSILGRFLARGGNFIDTANVYTKGHSEAILGDAIGGKSSRRDRIVIATKFFGNLYPGDPNGGGAGRKSILAACEQS